ncbi:MAG: beta-N-acetylhexosaminidase [Clostridium sp.]|nr:beta-N-acetylhexosaminidase [Clostridium sp.]
MKKMFVIVAAGVAFASCSSRPSQTASYDVIPLPQSVRLEEGKEGFALNEKTVIAYYGEDPAMKRNAELLAEYLKPLTGLELKVAPAPVRNAITLTDTLESDNAEAYRLTAGKDGIAIDGASAAGAFYGMQTLRKSIPQAMHADVDFPAVRIDDAPRFAYRGVHLDCSRHFFPVDSVKEYIDILALHNVNHFHWHLTDDQGWRIEVKKYPLLTEKGSWRKGTMVGTDFGKNDSIPYGGYYTQDDAREIVRYAAERHIDVVPEIDMPGHMQGALNAYPSLGCEGGPYEVWMRWGVSDQVLCAGNDSTYALIDDVIDELCEIFPSEYFHIGGDECPKTKWKECEKCQAKIRALGLKGDERGSAEQKLQTHVMNHAIERLAANGKRAIGWDEILEPGLEPSAVIMSWRGPKYAVKAAKMGHDAILTPTAYCYFDYLQAPDSVTDEQKLTYMTYLPVEKVYSLEPVDSTLTADEAKHILGAQCNVWCEYIPTLSYAEYKLLPRLAAMSETQWTQPGRKDIEDFLRRLPQIEMLYDAEGYRRFRR